MEQTVQPAPAGSRRVSDAVFVVLGVVAVVLTSAAYLLALTVISLGAGHCGFDPPPTAEIWRVRLWAVVAGVLWVSVPVSVTALARRSGRASQPWLVTTAVFVTFALLMSATIEPSGLCFF